MKSLVSNFKEKAIEKLRDKFLFKIIESVKDLSEESVWWKPHDETISIGIILKHLAGNVDQWIVSGLSGTEDIRNRREEFSSEVRPSKEHLTESLSSVINKSCEVIVGLDFETLEKKYSIQGYQVSGLEAIFNVVEHFSWHTGQVVWIAKMIQGSEHKISFYNNEKLNSAKNKN